jgi:hypothetical protein
MTESVCSTQNPSRATRRPPRVEITLELEEFPALRLFAETYEDEQRLRVWAGQKSTVRLLAEVIDGLAA